jgi:hypothetical protein
MRPVQALVGSPHAETDLVSVTRLAHSVPEAQVSCDAGQDLLAAKRLHNVVTASSNHGVIEMCHQSCGANAQAQKITADGKSSW